MIIIKALFYLSIFLVFYAFIGYPVSLYILSKLIKKQEKVDLSFKPFVSIIIPAHNEEKVIVSKLNNLCELNYPKEMLEIIIASDNSTDKTNDLVEEYIKTHPNEKIILYKVNERKGKTNAQNEAVRTAKGEILFFSDANSILDKEAVNQLVSSFVDEDTIYVSGRLVYVNSFENITSNAENSYWNYDLFMRKIESNVKTITAGNGAIYAIRKKEYVEFNPIKCHDSAMPIEAGIKNKRALYNERAIAYEKAGETSEDEFRRKVRMNRMILSWLFGDLEKYNFFKYGWFSYFYFGHRTLRYSLFILHSVIFITNLLLISVDIFYSVLFVLQVLFYIIAVLGKTNTFKNKMFYLPYYYSMTILAQFIGAMNQITGKSKPFWEKAETTR